MAFIKDILFPKTCLSCGFLGSYVCFNCQKGLMASKNQICLYCSRRSLYGLTHPSCRRNQGIDGFVALFHYNNILKKIIKNIKYRLVSEALEELFTIINPEFLLKIDVYKKFGNQLYLQPIPLHNRRLKERGFNQAQKITRFLAQITSLHDIDILKRKKDTSSQAQLKDKKSRFHNLRGAFEITGNYKDYKNIILVDDVVTSGSTVKAAAAVLKRNGAQRVYVFTVARG